MTTKIQTVLSVLHEIDLAQIEGPTFPGMMFGDYVIHVPLWVDGGMLWGDLTIFQVGPLLLARNHYGRLRVFLSAERAARYIAEV